MIVSSTCFCISFNFSASSSISFTLALMASSSLNIPPYNTDIVYSRLTECYLQQARHGHLINCFSSLHVVPPLNLKFVTKQQRVLGDTNTNSDTPSNQALQACEKNIVVSTVEVEQEISPSL